MGRRAFIHLWCLPWTEGRIGHAPLAVRGAFATLIALVGDGKFADEGWLAVCKDVGFSDHQIAGMLHCDMRTWAEHKTYLQETKDATGVPDPLIEVDNNNVIKVLRWERFQPYYRRQQDKTLSKTVMKTLPVSQGEKREERRERGRRDKKPLESSKEDSLSAFAARFVDKWNGTMGLKAGKIGKVGKTLLRALGPRLSEPDFVAEWESALAAQGRATWTVSWAWWLRNDMNWRKALDQEAARREFKPRDLLSERSEAFLREAEEERKRVEAEREAQ